MAGRCKTCSHPEVNKINEQLVSGVSPQSVADNFGLHYRGVLRHKENHLPKELVKAHQLQEAEAAENLIDRVEDIYSKAWAIVDKSESDQKYTASVQALREARSALELIGRLLGELKTGNTVNIHYNPQWLELRGVIFQALEDYPEARFKLAEELSKFEGGQIERHGEKYRTSA